MVTLEPRHEKTNNLVSDLVRHKPGCTATVTAKLICVFVFADAKFCFFSSHGSLSEFLSLIDELIRYVVDGN